MMNQFSSHNHHVQNVTLLLGLGVLLSAPLAIGCGGEGAGGDNDQAMIVGTWVGTDEFGDVQEEMVIAADGTLVITDFEETPAIVTSATYSLEDGLLTFEAEMETGDPAMPTATVITKQHIVVSEDRLGVSSLLPDGTVDGVVGSWSGFTESTVDGMLFLQVQTDVELAADGTAVLNMDGTSLFGPISLENAPGTYSESEPGVFEITYNDGTGDITVTFELVDGRGLSEAVFERQ